MKITDNKNSKTQAACKRHAQQRTILSLGLAAMIAGCAPTMADSAESIEKANLEKAVFCMELLELHHDFERADRECFGDQYIQHTPSFPDGKEVVLETFAARLEQFPDKTISIKRAAADGDLVWIHLHSTRSKEDPGNAVINIFRMQDGRFVEHWNVVQRVPLESRNDNGMF